MSMHTLITRTLAIGLTALLTLAPARADVSDSYAFKRYIESDRYMAWVEQLVGGIPDEVLRRCPALHLRRVSVKPLKFVSLNDSGVPRSGSWLYQLAASGCGEPRLLNLFFEAQGGGTVVALVGPPGTSKAGLLFPYEDDLRAVRQAVSLATAAARAAVGGNCAGVVAVRDTAFEAYGLPLAQIADPGETAHFRPWWETWTVVACDHRYATALEFAPGKQGIAVSVGPVVER